MPILSLATALISIGYLLLISSFILGWFKINKYKKVDDLTSDIYISLVIALRNEEINISNLLDSILNQSLSSKKFEVILVDDFSTDNTFYLISEFEKKYDHIRAFKLEGETGKKSAILYGVKSSKGSLILTSDADCIHHQEWLETIFSYYNTYKPKMILGPVLMESNTFFEGIQSIDFYSLMISGASACGLKMPIMCNGANLAFEKKLLNEFIDPLMINQVSGDDVFLLLNAKRKYSEKIHFIKSDKAVVITKPQSSLRNFIMQRQRWASKSANYRDRDIIIVAFIVLFINCLLLINFLIMIFDIRFWPLFVFPYSIKTSVDYIFIGSTLKTFKQSGLIKYFFPAQPFNLLTTIYSAIAGIFGSFQWKGRSYQKAGHNST